MKHILILILIAIPSVVIAQSTITYYDRYGYKTGKAKIEHQQSIQPTFKGDYYESSRPSNNQIINALSKKQTLYDSRQKLLLNRYNDILKTHKRLFIDYEEEYKMFHRKIAEYAEWMNKGDKDLSVDYIFNNSAKYLDDMEEHMYDVYRDIKREEKIKAIEQ